MTKKPVNKSVYQTEQFFVLQQQPNILVASLPGKLLLELATPAWRLKDPEKGFQRLVKEDRAREIAIAVLEQRRTFPNAIVLATDRENLSHGKSLEIGREVRFLVVDGQHRLWAQKFSDYDANYACLIHTGLAEDQMAELFLEINDNQKRVPSSLRWDLLRLVRPDADPEGIAAAELGKQLTEDEQSPMYQRIDLTGEQPELTIKLGSLAPEFKKLVSQRSALSNLPYFEQYAAVRNFLTALKQFDGDQWGRSDSPIYKARVLRAFLRLQNRITSELGTIETAPPVATYSKFVEKVDKRVLDSELIKAKQGNAGIAAIAKEIADQIF